MRQTLNKQSRSIKQAANALYNANNALFDLQERIGELDRQIEVLKDKKRLSINAVNQTNGADCWQAGWA